MKKTLYLTLIVPIFLAFNLAGQTTSFKFSNQVKTSNLSPAVDSIAGHGAAWGDIDGDGWPDLFVGVFSYKGKTNMLFRNQNGQFVLDDQPVFKFPTRATGMVFADLDNDGDLDLYFASMPVEKGKNEALMDGTSGNCLFENSGEGFFANISKSSGACPRDLGGRGVAVFDYDGDGLLDILAGADPMPGYSGSDSKSSRLFKNLGKLKFKDVTKEAGIPDEVPGYGAVASDFNNDGWPDFFLAASDGGNRLFINDRNGGFQENEKLNELFKWQWSGGDNMVCGVATGDVNNDGLMDIVLGSHFLLPWHYPQPIRLFLNRGEINGELRFEETTLQAALPLIYIKTPHVEIRDFDNDGWPDIYASAVKFNGDSIHPIISKNMGVSGKGIPKFVTDANDVNDFPTIAEMNYERTHPQDQFFIKIQEERRITYCAPGPTCDFDNDGLIDIFLASWWHEFPSMLLRNETVNDNNWIKVKVENVTGINRMGLGSKVKVYKAGRLGQAEDMIGYNEICISNGYASGQVAIAHFGLGDVSTVDVEVILPHGKGRVVKEGVKANQLITVN